jgi:cytoskeleton protein RodZ
MTIGSDLRQAREERGLSLRELSERTKIRLPILRAIDRDEFQGQAGGVIMRGYLKLYAREVGLDADEIGQRYTAQLESAGRDRGDGPMTYAGPHGERTALKADPRFARLAVAAAITGLALLTVGYFVFGPMSDRGPGSAQGDQRAADIARPADTSPPPGQAAPPTEPATSPEPKTAAAPSDVRPATAETPAGVVRVDLHATGACWVSAVADGRQVVYRMLNPGERVTINATNEAVVRIGIPANISATINGRPVRTFERPGTPVTLRITPANYRDLVQP